MSADSRKLESKAEIAEKAKKVAKAEKKGLMEGCEYKLFQKVCVWVGSSAIDSSQCSVWYRYRSIGTEKVLTFTSDAIVYNAHVYYAQCDIYRYTELYFTVMLIL